MFEHTMIGPGCTGSLVAANPEQLSDVELRDAVVGFDKLVAFAQAGQLAAMGEMARRADQEPVQAAAAKDGLGVPSAFDDPYRFLADEIGVELALSKMAASHRFHLAVELQTFKTTHQALREGKIDLPKAREIVEQLQRVQSVDCDFNPAAAAAEAVFLTTVEAAAVKFAESKTRMQTQNWLRRRLIALQPELAEVRRTKAVADRKVAHFPGDDGMSQLLADLPAHDAVAVWRMIDQVAHSSAYNGSNEHELVEDDLGAKDGAQKRSMDQRRADAFVDLILGRVAGSTSIAPVEVMVTVSADTLAGASTEPGQLAGYGPITAQHAQELAQGDGRWWQVLMDPATGAASGVTLNRSGSTNMSSSSNQGDKALKAGSVEERYHPSKGLTKLVQTRDDTCRFPGCRRAAISKGMDLDHIIPWDDGGPTVDWNLQVLCRSHHILKTHSEWTVEQLPGAVIKWTTPTGRVFTTYPTDHRPIERRSTARRPPDYRAGAPPDKAA